MLELKATAADLTAQLVDIPSESGDEASLTDLVEQALRTTGLSVTRDGNVVHAATSNGRSRRVILAGHLDTVPIADNLPSRSEGDLLYGCGTSDMKSGDAVALRMAQLIGSGALHSRYEVSWLFYDCEEIEASRNGLARIARESPSLLEADLAVLLEPTSGLVEGGCQGTLRAVVRTHGTRAHSARSWLGHNAIHAAAPILVRLADYVSREIDVEGLTYREGLNAVRISGGVAGNVVPDLCEVTVNFRFAPDRTIAQAQEFVRNFFDQFDVEFIDLAPAARPGLDGDMAQAFVRAVGGSPAAKLGWTDVARFGELGIPALNFGPGDPNMAHKRDEYVELSKIHAAEAALAAFLADQR